MKEIYTLNIKCVTGAYLEEAFSWVVEAPSDMTLGKLHDHILDYTGFDDDHMATFYTARTWHAWRKVELIEDEDGADWDKILAQIYPLAPNHRLFYLYDFGDNWVFSIGKRAKVKTARPDEYYPNVIKETGKIPDQYPDIDD